MKSTINSAIVFTGLGIIVIALINYCLVGGLKDLVFFAQSNYKAYSLLGFGVIKMFGLLIFATAVSDL